MKMCRKIITYTAVSLLSFSAVAEQEPSVWLENNVIHYSGDLSNQLNKRLFELYSANKDTVNLVAIESKGGEINTGLDLGSFIFENKLNIKVASYCLSSCANYVFTAGHTKYVEKDTVIGFHGGASSNRFDTSQLDGLPKSKRAKLKKQLEDYIAKTVEKETAFFQTIGVQQQITTYGQQDHYLSFAKQGYSGWYYPIESLEKLGVQNIVVNGLNWQPKELSETVRFFKVDIANR